MSNLLKELTLQIHQKMSDASNNINFNFSSLRETPLLQQVDTKLSKIIPKCQIFLGKGEITFSSNKQWKR